MLAQSLTANNTCTWSAFRILFHRQGIHVVLKRCLCVRAYVGMCADTALHGRPSRGMPPTHQLTGTSFHEEYSIPRH